MIDTIPKIPFLATLETNIDNTAYEIITNILPQLSVRRFSSTSNLGPHLRMPIQAIYPVIIILLVALEKTHLEYTITSVVSQPINFMHGANSTTSTTTGPIRLGAGLRTLGTDVDDGMKEKSKPASHPTSSVDFVSRDDSPQ